MRLPPDDLRRARPWTENPAMPLLGLTDDADVLLVLHRQPVRTQVELAVLDALPRVWALAQAQGSRLWLKMSDQDDVVPCTPTSGHDLLGGPWAGDATQNDVDVLLGQALHHGWSLPNGHRPTHMVWMSGDGLDLPGELFHALQRRALPFTLFMAFDRSDVDVRGMLMKQRPGMRYAGMRELAQAEREVEMRDLRAALDAECTTALPARPARRL